MASPYLSREELEAVIDQGGTVLHRGVHITRKEHLPTKAELAEDDPDRQAEAFADWQRRLAALEAERASFVGERSVGSKSTPEGATVGAKAAPGAKVKAPTAEEQTT